MRIRIPPASSYLYSVLCLTSLVGRGTTEGAGSQVRVSLQLHVMLARWCGAHFCRPALDAQQGLQTLRDND